MSASTATSSKSVRRGVSLRLRLVLLMLLITVPIVALVNILIASWANELLTEDAKQQLLLVNRALSANAQGWLNSHFQALQAMVSLPETASMEPSQQTPLLQAVTNAYPNLYLAQTVDLNGANVARSDNGTPQTSADQQWFQLAKSGKTATELLLTREVYKPGLVMAAPIKDASGKVVGVGAISSNLDDISSQVFSSVIGRTGYGYIVDGNNHVVAHPDMDQVRADFGSAPPVAALRNGLVGAVTYVDERGVPWLAYVSRLENGWGVIVQEQMEELLSSVRPFQQIAWLALGIGIVLLAALTWVVIGRALQPIKTLTQVATAAAGGDLSQSAPLRHYDEVGILSEAFNTMIARLRDLIGSLETRVAMRTEQLRAGADVGQAAVSILDTNQLLREIVNLITDRFGFYYTAVFLADSTNKWAVLHEATGEAGRILKERKHQLEIGGQSMVGSVMKTRKARIALDVGDEAVRFANPLLPDTRSEIALPLVIGTRAIGALDVQSTQMAAFDEASAAVLQSMADQIAIALSNTLQFQQAQTALQRTRQLYETSTAISNAADAAGVLQQLMTSAAADADAAQILTYGPRDDAGQYDYFEVAASWATRDGMATLPAAARVPPDQIPPIAPLASEPYIIRDAADTAVPLSQQEILRSMGMRALLGYALVAGSQPIGLLLIAYRNPHMFTPAETQPLQALAGQIAVTLRNQQLVREQVTARQQLDEVNRRLTGQVWEQYARARGQVLRKADVGPGVQQDDLPSQLAAPVLIHGQEIGQLHLEDAAPDREWSPSEQALIQAVAGEVAIAIENARLIEQTERRAQREARLNQIAQQLRQTTDIHSILQTAAEQLSLALDTSHAQAHLGTPHTRRTARQRPNGHGDETEEGQL